MTCPAQTSVILARYGESAKIPLLRFEDGTVALSLVDAKALFGVAIDARLTKGVRKAQCVRLGRSGEFWLLGLSSLHDAALRLRDESKRARAESVIAWAKSIGVSERLWGDDDPGVTIASEDDAEEPRFTHIPDSSGESLSRWKVGELSPANKKFLAELANQCGVSLDSLGGSPLLTNMALHFSARTGLATHPETLFAGLIAMRKNVSTRAMVTKKARVPQPTLKFRPLAPNPEVPA